MSPYESAWSVSGQVRRGNEEGFLVDMMKLGMIDVYIDCFPLLEFVTCLLDWFNGC